MTKEQVNIFSFLRVFSRKRKLRRFEKKYLIWKKNGATLPMPHYGKKLSIEEYVTRFKPEVFIETGTYTGHMVLSMLDKFKKVYSIELDKVLYQKAVGKFRNYKQVQLLQGESDKVLKQLMPDIKSPCLFWLDAHYSGGQTAKGNTETPIIQELDCILSHPLADRHILLIDDARCFDGTHDYPRLEALRDYICERRPHWLFETKDDIIRTYNKNL